MKWLHVLFPSLLDAVIQLLFVFLVLVAAAQQEAASLAEVIPEIRSELETTKAGLMQARQQAENGEVQLRGMKARQFELETQLGDEQANGLRILKKLGDRDGELGRIQIAFRDLGAEYAGFRAKAENDATTLGLVIGRLTDQVNAAKFDLDLTVQAKNTLERENAVLKGKLRSGSAVTLVILIDLTSSMKEALEMTRTSTATLFEVMPNTSRDFRVGVLAFRRGVVKRFPITKILPTYEDDGASQRAALDFLDSLNVENAMTDHLPVFEEAIQMLRDAHPVGSAERKERLILISDVGVSEFDEQQGYSAPERLRKDLILRTLRDWASQHDRAVEALYTEGKWAIENDPARAENKAWFADLGRVSAKSAFYTESSAILRAVLHASLPSHKGD